jgi:hypothetical protein
MLSSLLLLAFKRDGSRGRLNDVGGEGNALITSIVPTLPQLVIELVPLSLFFFRRGGLGNHFFCGGDDDGGPPPVCTDNTDDTPSIPIMLEERTRYLYEYTERRNTGSIVVVVVVVAMVSSYSSWIFVYTWYGMVW